MMQMHNTVVTGIINTGTIISITEDTITMTGTLITETEGIAYQDMEDIIRIVQGW